MRADRRTVLLGAGALTLAACGEALEIRSDPGAWEVDLRQLEVQHGGRIGLHAMGDDMVSWRADERFTYCSTFKLFLAAATLERAQNGEERLDRAIPITFADMISHAPVTEPAVGRTLTIRDLCKATVEVSDNPAANILIREMGGLEAWKAWYPSIGDAVTRVDRLEPQLNQTGDERDTTTPAQTVANLWTVLTKRPGLLNDDHRTMLEQWLFDSPTGLGRIKAGVPAGWRVAHKTGTSGDGLANDIGVIYPPSGEPIRIAVYYAGTADQTDAQREAVIAEATRLALKALGHG
ncbi:class A beta-lactamase [Brevundimonas sp.]|uniref:class A beta-lactamase n=1 Tax=Brevundimonas sp. TaxID=1871086 RepID=UPI003D6C75B2